jgi:hypothetical protein
MKQGGRVTFERERERGFRTRYRGIIEQTLADGALAVVRVVGAYAYHPSNPEGGRELPVRQGGEMFAQEVATLTKVED